MHRIIRFLIGLLGTMGAIQALGQTPVPIPVTGNLTSIIGAGQAYAGVSIQLLNCPAPVSIPAYSVIVQQGYQVQADPSGVVNTTVWPNDLIDCNGTLGNSQYQVSYVANGAVQGTPQCYQVISTQTWNLNSQQPISCNGSAPNPLGPSCLNANTLAKGCTGATTQPGAFANIVGPGGTLTGPLTAPQFNGNVAGTLGTFTGQLSSKQSTFFTLAPQAQIDYGTSITHGSGLDDLQRSYIFQLANYFGYGPGAVTNIAPWGAVTNRGIAGALSADISEQEVFANDVPVATSPQIMYTVEDGTNDASKGAGPYEQTFLASYNAMLTYLPIPSNYKTMGSTMVSGATGTCAQDTHYGPIVGNITGTTVTLAKSAVASVVFIDPAFATATNASVTLQFYDPVSNALIATTTGSITTGSPTVTVTSATGIVAGQHVVGTGIPLQNQGVICTANASTASGTITTTGGAQYLWARSIDGDAGVYTYSVKNSSNVVVASGTVTTALTTPFSNSLGGNQATVLAARVPALPTDTYTWTFTQTHSGTMAIVGIGTVPAGSYQYYPFVVTSDIPNRLNGARASDNAAYRADIYGAVAQAQADGLNVYLAPVSQYMPMTTAAGDVYATDGLGVHPNDLGHDEMTKGFLAGIKGASANHRLTVLQPNLLPDPLFIANPAVWVCHDASMTFQQTTDGNGFNSIVATGTGSPLPAGAYCVSPSFPVVPGQQLFLQANMNGLNIVGGNTQSIQVKDAVSGTLVGQLLEYKLFSGMMSITPTVPAGTTSVYMQVNANGSTITNGLTATFNNLCIANQIPNTNTICEPQTQLAPPSGIGIPGSNVVTNGDFEGSTTGAGSGCSGTVGIGWGTFSNAGTSCVATVDTVAPHGGTHSQKLVGVGITGNQEMQIHQSTIPMTAGTQYKVSVYAKSDGSSGIGFYYSLKDVSNNRQCKDVAPVILTGTWTLYTSICTATITTSSNGQLLLNTTGAVDGTVWYDDIAIQPLTAITTVGQASQLGASGTGPNAATTTGSTTNGNVAIWDANGNVINSSTALSSLTPASVLTLWSTATGASTAVASADVCKITRFSIPSPGVLVSGKMTVKTGGTTDNTNATSFAIYNSTGATTLLHTTAQVFPSTGAQVELTTVESNVTLPAGVYLFGYCSASGTQLFVNIGVGSNLCGGTGTAPTAGQNPTSTTVPSNLPSAACSSMPTITIY